MSKVAAEMERGGRVPRTRGENGKRFKGNSCSEWIFFRILVLSMAGKNTPGLLDLQNLASEHSCVAAAVQAAEMLVEVRAGGTP